MIKGDEGDGTSPHPTQPTVRPSGERLDESRRGKRGRSRHVWRLFFRLARVRSRRESRYPVRPRHPTAAAHQALRASLQRFVPSPDRSPHTTGPLLLGRRDFGELSPLLDRNSCCAIAWESKTHFQLSKLDTLCRQASIFSSKDEPEDGGWGFLRSWGSFLVFWF